LRAAPVAKGAANSAAAQKKIQRGMSALFIVEKSGVRLR
jgi:hypothetical protein